MIKSTREVVIHISLLVPLESLLYNMCETRTQNVIVISIYGFSTFAEYILPQIRRRYTLSNIQEICRVLTNR
ncbi:hypothetical protein SAMN02927914_01012 [Mesorhizobium qingshengii]|uniref:Uncharacterized protein n=1 Tax=Mesorhizobium qingshengii TaxID=1165689 RepID=A0A1G5W1E6_9HYPH|nr:hypothetical protein SAMN02927914_01012 [Mesorhizobium qingshengii]